MVSHECYFPQSYPRETASTLNPSDNIQRLTRSLNSSAGKKVRGRHVVVRPPSRSPHSVFSRATSSVCLVPFTHQPDIRLRPSTSHSPTIRRKRSRSIPPTRTQHKLPINTEKRPTDPTTRRAVPQLSYTSPSRVTDWVIVYTPPEPTADSRDPRYIARLITPAHPGQDTNMSVKISKNTLCAGIRFK